jgi:hypothetical protein
MMNGYIVKLKRSKDMKPEDGDEMVGFFVATDLVELFWTIDELTSPFSCEFKTVRNGGVLWPGSAKILSRDEEIRRYEEDEDYESEPFDEPSALSERLDMALSDHRKWKSFPDNFEYIYDHDTGELVTSSVVVRSILGHDKEVVDV